MPILQTFIILITLYFILWIIMSKIESFFRSLFDYSAFEASDRESINKPTTGKSDQTRFKANSSPSLRSNSVSYSRNLNKSNDFKQPATSRQPMRPSENENVQNGYRSSNSKATAPNNGIKISTNLRNLNGRRLSREELAATRELYQIERSMNEGGDQEDTNKHIEKGLRYRTAQLDERPRDVKQHGQIYPKNSRTTESNGFNESSNANYDSNHAKGSRNLGNENSSFTRSLPFLKKPSQLFSSNPKTSRDNGKDDAGNKNNNNNNTLEKVVSQSVTGNSKVQNLIHMHQNKILYNKKWSKGNKQDIEMNKNGTPSPLESVGSKLSELEFQYLADKNGYRECKENPSETNRTTVSGKTIAPNEKIADLGKEAGIERGTKLHKYQDIPIERINNHQSQTSRTEVSRIQGATDKNVCNLEPRVTTSTDSSESGPIIQFSNASLGNKTEMDKTSLTHARSSNSIEKNYYHRLTEPSIPEEHKETIESSKPSLSSPTSKMGDSCKGTFVVETLKPKNLRPQIIFEAAGRKSMLVIVTGGTKGLGKHVTLQLCRIFLDSAFGDPNMENDLSQICPSFDIIVTTSNDCATNTKNCSYSCFRELQQELNDMVQEIKLLEYSTSSPKSTEKKTDIRKRLLLFPQLNLHLEHLDLSKPETIKTFKSAVTNRYGKRNVDILINNAAICLENNFSSFNMSSNVNRDGNYGLRRSFRRNSINSAQSPSTGTASSNGLNITSGTESEIDNKKDVQNGFSNHDEDQTLPLAEKRLTDYEIADSTFLANFWSLQELCAAIFPILATNARVVNVTCSAGSARNIRNPQIQSQLRATVNNPIEVPKNQRGDDASSLPIPSTSWFSSSYFNLELFPPKSSSELTDSKAADDKNSNIMSSDELRQLVNSYLASTKKMARTKEGWNGTHYSVSKLAVTVLSAIQQRELDARMPEKRILVNSCCPGYIKTSLSDFKGYLEPEQASETPVLLATIPINLKQPRGRFYYQMRPKIWN